MLLFVQAKDAAAGISEAPDASTQDQTALGLVVLED
jgi:hypothetical protein